MAGRSAQGESAPRVRPDSRLREIYTGLWEGLAFEEAKERYPREYAERERDLIGYPFPGGESFRDVRERVLPAFWRIVDEGGANVIIVTHKGPLRLLLCEFLGLPPEESFSLRADYCSIATFMVSGATSSTGGVSGWLMPTLPPAAPS